MDISLITLFSYKLLFFTLFSIAKKKYSQDDCKECSFYKKETVERVYSTIYDKVNLLLDKLREIILLQNTKNLAKLLVTITFFITFGNLFDTLTLALLLFDFYVVFNFVSKTEQYTTYRQTLHDFSHQQYGLIKSMIPKYVESQKKKD